MTMRTSHPHDEVGNVIHDPRATRLLPPRAIVPLPSNEPSVPGQEGVRGADTGDFGQEFPAEGLALCGEPPAFVVRETESLPAEPSLQDAILLKQVDDSGPLVTLDPTSHGDDQ